MDYYYSIKLSLDYLVLNLNLLEELEIYLKFNVIPLPQKHYFIFIIAMVTNSGSAPLMFIEKKAIIIIKIKVVIIIVAILLLVEVIVKVKVIMNFYVLI